LGLTDVDVAPIEAQITTQIESYHQKLQQYEQAFVKATQRQHYPDEVTQKQLQQTWQTLGLSEGDVGAIARRINAEIETHQANLRQYEQEFTEGVQQEYPLSAFKRSQLTQRHQALNLTAEDVTAIENPITAAITEHRQKLQQYEEVFRESMQFEYPLSDATREELKRFQDILELSAQEVAQIEAKSIGKSEVNVEVLSQVSKTKQENQIVPESIEVRKTNFVTIFSPRKTQKSKDFDIPQEVVQKSIEVLESKLVSNTSTPPIIQKSEDLKSEYKSTSSKLVRFVAWGVPGSFIVIIAAIYFHSQQENITGQANQRINENVVLTWARNFQLKKEFGNCAKLMLERADFFTEINNKTASQSLLNECQSSLKKESVANAQKFEQNLNLIIKKPKRPVPELYILILTPQQVISLNTLYAKFNQVASDASAKSGLAATYEEWRGICIGTTGTSSCEVSLAREIVNHKNLFADYRLVTSSGWILYKP
jgi:hypothetical protein